MIVRLKMILNEITNISENVSLGKNNPKKSCWKNHCNIHCNFLELFV